MPGRIDFVQLLKRGALGTALAVIGVFLGVRLKAFLLQAWSLEIPTWSLLIVSGAMFVVSALFYKQILSWLDRWCMFPSIGALIITAFCTALAFVWSDRLYQNALFGSGVTVGTIAKVIYFVGAGLLLSVFILCLIISIRDRFREIKSIGFNFCKTDAMFMGAVLLLLNVAVLIYAKSSSTIYFWDNAGYWTTAHKLCELWKDQGIGALLKAVVNSVTTEDYNYIIILPAIVATRLFGTSRYVFLASIANAWLYPSYVLVWLFAKRRCKHYTIIASTVILSVPMLVYNVLVGFVDVGGVFAISLALVLLFGDNDKKADFGRYFLIGVCLAAALLLRRWYAFYALAFIIVLALVWLVEKRTLIPAIGALSSFAFVLLFFFQTLVSGKLLADYGAMYSAYSIGLDKDFLLFFRYFGIIPTIAFAAAMIVNIVNRDHRAANVLVLCQTVLCFIMFSRVQTHGQQHLLLYTANLMFPIVLTLCRLESIISHRVGSLAAMGCALVFAASPFLPRVQPTSLEGLKYPSVLPSFSWAAPTREDSHTIVTLIRRLDEYGLQGKRVGILASSFVLNEDILKNAEASLSLARVSDVDRSYIAWLPAVDQRDGWSDALLSCDVVVVADPIQLHLGRDNQAVVWLPAEQILLSEGIGRAFVKTGESFTLNDGVTAYIYEKTRDITPKEWADLSAEFYAIHP